jgi:hypothetical protein
MAGGALSLLRRRERLVEEGDSPCRASLERVDKAAVGDDVGTVDPRGLIVGEPTDDQRDVLGLASRPTALLTTSSAGPID